MRAAHAATHKDTAAARCILRGVLAATDSTHSSKLCVGGLPDFCAIQLCLPVALQCIRTTCNPSKLFCAASPCMRGGAGSMLNQQAVSSNCANNRQA